MRKTVQALLCATLLAGAAGCATTGGPGAQAIVPQLPPYSGPQARIAVARFDYKAAKGHGRVGEGLADMLTTELVNSHRFMVLERDRIQDVLTEQDLGASGRVAAATAAPVGEIAGAELLVIGAVTEFEPNKMGLGGILLGGATIIGSALVKAKNEHVPIVAATYTESYLAMDIRLVDTATSRVLSASTVEGKAIDLGGGLLSEIGGGRSRLPLAFGGWQKTSAEKAMRIAIARAVERIVADMPPEYYRHAAEAPADGQLLGFTFLDFPAKARAFPGERQTVMAGSAAEVRDQLASRGLPEPLGIGQVDFSTETVVVALGGTSDRGATISAQQAVVRGGKVILELALLPAVEAQPEDGKKPAEPLPIPFVAVRVPSAGLPVEVVFP